MSRRGGEDSVAALAMNPITERKITAPTYLPVSPGHETVTNRNVATIPIKAHVAMSAIERPWRRLGLVTGRWLLGDRLFAERDDVGVLAARAHLDRPSSHATMVRTPTAVPPFDLSS